MKKTILGLLILASIGTLTGCNTNNFLNEKAKEITFESMYDYSAISGINLLNTNFATNLKMSKVTDTEKQDILDNLKVIEGMMESSITKSEELPSDKEGYETMYTLTSNNFDGSVDHYKFYYNETIIKDRDDDYELFEEKEEESKIDGLVVMDGVEYTMVGEKEVEGKDLEMKFKIQLDDNNYVVIQQELESDEEEFKNSKYEDGKKVFETSLELEKGVFDKDFEYSFKNQTAEGLVSYKYDYEVIGIDKYIIVKKEINDNKETIKIKVVVDNENNINYIFE